MEKHLEKYKEALKRKLTVSSLYFASLLVLNPALRRFSGENHMTDFIMGALIGVGLVMIFFVGTYVRALRDEKELKKLYIKEHDERQLLIQTKIGGTGITIVLGGVVLAMLAAGYFNETVFFTLLSVLGFICLVMLALKFYYNKKI